MSKKQPPESIELLAQVRKLAQLRVEVETTTQARDKMYQKVRRWAKKLDKLWKQRERLAKRVAALEEAITEARRPKPVHQVPSSQENNHDAR